MELIETINRNVEHIKAHHLHTVTIKRYCTFTVVSHNFFTACSFQKELQYIEL